MVYEPGCQYTDVALPPHQPISSTTHCRAKLFFVAAPQPISEDILSDIFCRFSELVDIQIIPVSGDFELCITSPQLNYDGLQRLYNTYV